MEKNIELDTIKKRMQILIAGKLRDEIRIKEAMKAQDKLSEKSGSWSGEEEIIKWRKKQKF